MTAKKDSVISVEDFSELLSPIEGKTTRTSTPLSDVSYTIKFPQGSYVYWSTPFSHIPDKGIITYDGSDDYGLNGIDMFSAKYSINLNDVKLESSFGDKGDQEEYGNTTNVKILPRNGEFNTKDDDSIDFAELKKRNLLKDIYVEEN